MPEDQKRQGPDPDGFFTLSALRARASGSADDFAAGCPGPALFVERVGDEGAAPVEPDARGASALTPSGSGFRLLTLEGGQGTASVAARRYHDRVAFIAKRPGNPFPNMISLGRSTSNDVVLSLETVSKLHGYFLREGDGWFYTDYQSTNGTHVNGKRVEKGERRPLADGDRFKIGLDVMAVFLLPRSLHSRIRGGSP